MASDSGFSTTGGSKGAAEGCEQGHESIPIPIGRFETGMKRYFKL